MNNLPYIIIAVLTLALIICISRTPDTETVIETKVETRTVTEIDTVFVTDTVYVDMPVPEPDTVYINDQETLRYTTFHSDSLIDATITTWSEGPVVNQTFSYTPNFPKYITRTDSVFVDRTTEITRTRYPSGIFVGADIAVIADELDFSPKIQYVRRDFSIGYRYGIVHNSHNLSLTIRL